MPQNPPQSPAQNACIYAINIDKDPVKSGVSWTMNLLINICQKYATFLRYAVVGALGTAVDMGTLALLTEFSGIDPQTSSLFPAFVTCAFVAAVINNYILNRLWTFKSQDKNVRKIKSKIKVKSWWSAYLVRDQSSW